MLLQQVMSDHTVDLITTGNIIDYTTDIITTGNIFDHDITCCNNIK
jgi:hypothetical protein